MIKNILFKKIHLLIIFTFAFFIWWIYLTPLLPLIHWNDLSWPIFLKHLEATSLSTSGKWSLSRGTFFTDSFSGDFIIFYQYFSDLINNMLSILLDIPPMVIQSLIIGPFLGFLFPLSNYFFISKATENKTVALIASVLVSVTTDSKIWTYFPISSLPNKMSDLIPFLHVPFVALSLDVAQSLGWILFLPALCTFKIAYETRSFKYKILCGVISSVLLQTHTLTFINYFVCALLYLIFEMFLNRKKQQFFTQIKYLLNFLWLPLLCAGILSFPYLYILFKNRALILNAQSLITMTKSIKPLLLMNFYLAHIIPFIVASYFLKKQSNITNHLYAWLMSFFIGTLILSYNNYLHWGNHPYRFAIHLIFPFSIFTGFGFYYFINIKKFRIFSFIFGIWFIIIGYVSIIEFIGNKRIYAHYDTFTEKHHIFLKTIASHTQPENYLLNPPEFSYPQGVAQSAILLNYSKSPGYIPDFRYLLWRDRYSNRMRLFCYLFPTYPHSDHNPSFNACHYFKNPEFEIQTQFQALKNNILHAYGIKHVASIAPPFTPEVNAAILKYQWLPLIQDHEFSFAEIPDHPIPHSAQFFNGIYNSTGFTVHLIVKNPGDFTFVLHGFNLLQNVGKIFMNGNEITTKYHNPETLIFSTQITQKENQLAFHWGENLTPSFPENADYFYFIAGIEKKFIRDFFDFNKKLPFELRNFFPISSQKK